MDNGVIQFIKVITDFGVLIVIAAIFLYAAIRLINLWIRSLEGKIKNRESDHDKMLDIRQDVNEKIQSLIEQFLESHHCSRVQVIEFSNSVLSVAYLPFKYMSCTYEVYDMGAMAAGSKIDRLSTSLFTPFFKKLYENPYIVIDPDKIDSKIGMAVYELLNLSKEKKALCAILKTSRGKALGYVSIYQGNEFSQDDKEEIQILADKISALLGIADR